MINIVNEIINTNYINEYDIKSIETQINFIYDYIHDDKRIFEMYLLDEYGTSYKTYERVIDDINLQAIRITYTIIEKILDKLDLKLKGVLNDRCNILY